MKVSCTRWNASGARMGDHRPCCADRRARGLCRACIWIRRHRIARRADFLAALLECVLGSYMAAFERIDQRLEEFDVHAMRGYGGDEDIERLIEMRVQVGVAPSATRASLGAGGAHAPGVGGTGDNASGERFQSARFDARASAVCLVLADRTSAPISLQGRRARRAEETTRSTRAGASMKPTLLTDARDISEGTAVEIVRTPARTTFDAT